MKPQRISPLDRDTRARPLILVVDDYSDNREMYGEYLGFKGFDVAEAATGQEAIDKAFALRPDLIMMDLSLPGMNGWEATRLLKADERTKAIPILMVTGYAQSEDAKIAAEVGCDAFLAKPCLPEDLNAQIDRMLARARGLGLRKA